ncbi:MAG: radical SAM family heme chaperone HemW [Acutalibacter sp.]|nr:radical SAM family heme chaperone HemW [Acutalibacter sp.]
MYVHVPFCDGKCPYCDFYSLRGDGELMDRYTAALEREIRLWAKEHGKKGAHTVYFGGGTPSLLGAERLSALLAVVRDCFDLAPEAEITLEANPVSVDEAFFRGVREAGFNRLSMGMQSGVEEELRFLGRKHTLKDVENAVQGARKAGFDNLSLDLMLGLPEGTENKLKKSIDFAAGLGADHISAYLLKIEPGTPFAARNITVPEDDVAADQYLFCVKELRKRGYAQYEISNFAKPEKESRHNLVYWHGEEYLGFGPGAHSFYEGKRFFYPRDLAGFLAGNPPQDDGEGGSFSEYAMLNLRLTEGLQRKRCIEKFGPAGQTLFDQLKEKTKKCPPGFFSRADSEKISFTPEGFLVSNALLLQLLG